MSDEQKTNKKIIVCYTVDYDNEYSVDINIENYEEQTLTHLSTLLASIPSVQFQILALTFSSTTLLRSKERNNGWIFGGQHVQKTADNSTLTKFVLLEA